MDPQPFLENDQAKEHLMIVIPPGYMLFKKLTHGLRPQVLVDSRAAIEQCIRHLAVDCAAEPFIYNIYSESTFGPFHAGARVAR